MAVSMVSKSHIDAIVAIVNEGPAQSGISKRDWKDGINRRGILPTGTENALNALGDLLVRENLSSIHYRYPDTVANPEDTPGPCNLYWLREYVYEQPTRIPTVVEAFKVIKCYEYQSCEHPEWEDSEAQQICEELRLCLILALPGYEAAPWEWDEVSA